MSNTDIQAKPSLRSNDLEASDNKSSDSSGDAPFKDSNSIEQLLVEVLEMPCVWAKDNDRKEAIKKQLNYGK